MPPRFASVPLWWGDGFFELAGGVCAWQLPLSVAPRDPSHGEWCPLLRPSSLGLFSASVKLVLSGAVLLCVLGHSDVRMQWAEVLRLLLLLLGNRCHFLGNRWSDCTQNARLLVPAALFSLWHHQTHFHYHLWTSGGWVQMIILAHRWDFLVGWNHNLLFLDASSLSLRNVMIRSRITSQKFLDSFLNWAEGKRKHKWNFLWNYGACF